MPNIDIGIFPEHIVAIREIALYFKDKPDYHVYLRVHPHLKDKLKNTQMQEIVALKKENIPNAIFIRFIYINYFPANLQ